MALLLIEDYVRMRFWTELSVAVMILFLGSFAIDGDIFSHEAPAAVFGLTLSDLYLLVFAAFDLVPEHAVLTLVHT